MAFKDISRVSILVALLLAAIFPQPAFFLKDYLIFILVFMLSISIRNLGAEHLDIKKKEFVAFLVFINTVVLAALYIILSNLMIANELYRNALIIYGLMPPAIGIVTLGYLYHVNMKVDLYAEFIGYILSLLVVPLGTYFFMRTVVAPVDILEVIITLLAVPMILSRLIRRISIPEKILKSTIAVCFGMVIYIIVGFNLEMVLQSLGDILNIILLLVILRIVLLVAIYFIARRYLSQSDSILVTLFGTMKNGAAATAISVMLLGVESTVPLALEVIFFTIGLIIMDWLFTGFRKRDHEEEKRHTTTQKKDEGTETTKKKKSTTKRSKSKK